MAERSARARMQQHAQTLRGRKEAASRLGDENENASPLRQLHLRFDRSRYAEARANGLTRREAMLYAKDTGQARLALNAGVVDAEPAVQADIMRRLEEKQHMLLDYMDDDTMAEADVAKLASAFAIITDRLRLYQGKATSISEKRDALTDEDRQKVLSILNRLQPRIIHDAPQDGPAATNANGDPLPLVSVSGVGTSGPSGGDVAVVDGGSGP